MFDHDDKVLAEARQLAARARAEMQSRREAGLPATNQDLAQIVYDLTREEEQ